MSKLEAVLDLQIRAYRLPAPVPEYAFAQPRRWRFDRAWPDKMVAVEVEGGLYVNGRHSRGAGYEDDLDKYAEALCRGWRVLRMGPRLVNSGAGVRMLERLLR